MIKKKIIIKGPKVQDVGYRPFLLNIADSEDIPRFDARNKNGVDEDGDQIVEILIGGDLEAVDRFIEFIKLGVIVENKDNRPEKANVKSVDVVDNDYKGNIRTTESFSRWLSNNQLYKMTSIGGEMLYTQGVMVGKMDTMLEKQDMMLGKQDETIQEIKKVAVKQDETIQEIRDMRKDIKSYIAVP